MVDRLPLSSRILLHTLQAAALHPINATRVACNVDRPEVASTPLDPFVRAPPHQVPVYRSLLSTGCLSYDSTKVLAPDKRNLSLGGGTSSEEYARRSSISPLLPLHDDKRLDWPSHATPLSQECTRLEGSCLVNGSRPGPHSGLEHDPLLLLIFAGAPREPHGRTEYGGGETHEVHSDRERRFPPHRHEEGGAKREW